MSDLDHWSQQAELRVKKALQTLKTPRSKRKLSVAVSIIGTPAMVKLNTKYRGKKKPTDVLSFPAPEFFQKQGMLGDLIICLPVLKRQARELGHTPEQELDVLLVHGILHLLGYDHELGPKEAERMARRERQLLSKLWKRNVKDLPKGLIERNH